MIGTIEIKRKQLENCSYSTGSGPTRILLVGSCRSIPYLNYLSYLNSKNLFTIHFIDPFNWNWDINENRVDYEQAINSLETNKQMMEIIHGTKWYIHEYYQNYGMFNNSKDSPKNIYQFGMNPELDICIPNFHCIFILFQDIITFDKAINEEVAADLKKIGAIGLNLQIKIKETGLASVDKFCRIALLTSFPEMSDLFKNTWRAVRYFWNINHITNNFTRTIFEMLDNNYLHLNPDKSFWDRVKSEDMYKNPHTPITQYDVDNYGITWPEPIAPLKV